MRLRRCGSDAVLVEVDSLGEVSAVRAAVRAADLPNLVELVPAARTVLISVRPGTSLTA
ncbi:MAG: carboxyltransferase domain-containing protein, partial [Umezawaea sp.]